MRIFVILILIILIFLIPESAFADERYHNLSIGQEFNTNSDEADSTFEYKLRPFERGAPMPPEGTDEEYVFTITGNDITEVGPFVFTSEGLYKYRLFQTPESKKPDYKHDQRKYTIEMYIGEKLDADVIVLNEDGTKAKEIMFQNEYIKDFGGPGTDPDPPVTDPDPPITDPDRPTTEPDRPAVNESSPPNARQGLGNLAKTGDDMDIVMYVSILMFSGILAFGLAVFLYKHKRRSQ